MKIDWRTNPRLTRGLWCICRTTVVLLWLMTSVPTPLCLCEISSKKTVPGTQNSISTVPIYRMQNPEISRAGQAGCARRGGRAVGRGGDEQNETPTDRFAQKTTVPHTFQTIEDKPSGRIPGSTSKRNPVKKSGRGTVPAIDVRTKYDLRFWLLTSKPKPVCPCKLV